VVISIAIVYQRLCLLRIHIPEITGPPDRFGTYNSSAPRWVGMLQLDRINLWVEMVGLTLDTRLTMDLDLV
jgi:hypothetical protein